MLRVLGLLAALLILYVLLHSNAAELSDVTPNRIDEILANPRGFEGKVVTVRGIVTGGVGVMGAGGYHLRDPDGRLEIFVLTMAGVPPAGTLVTISGTFHEAATVDTYQLPIIILRP